VLFFGGDDPSSTQQGGGSSTKKYKLPSTFYMTSYRRLAADILQR
jgi:hypothetical protein